MIKYYSQMNMLKIFIVAVTIGITYINAFTFHDLSIPIKSKKTDTCNILSFSGAGSFGAVEAGILNQLILGNPNAEYDMITGVSAGGLNAGFLEYYNDGKNLAKGVQNLRGIYANMTNDDIYVRNMYDITTNWAYYDTSVLRKTLEKQLAKLDTNIMKPTLVGSTNLNTGDLDIFRFDKSTKLEQLNILMATSAIPFLFPPEKININGVNTVYVDGGVISNEILSGAMSYINCNRYNITFITANEKMKVNNNIDSLSTFSKRVIEVMVTDFNNQLAAMISNPCETNIRGDINYCYPKTDKLNAYSFLDFGNGEALYQLGNDYYVCDRYNYCG
jgi:predicted acylesterase/phospholipase RssA